MISRNESPLISVIIPTYNCADYLHKAIDSVLSQEYGNVEIIIVDDASTDNTQDAFKEKYSNRSNIKMILNGENRKQGASRNIGLDNAEGKYIFFLDADDSINQGAFEKMVSIAEEYQAEIVACGINQTWDDGRIKQYHAHDFASNGGVEALNYFASYEIGSIVWNKLYLRSFLEEKKLKFVDSHGKEDVIFTINAVYDCKKYISISDLYYNYFQREDSCVNSVPSIAHLISYIQLYSDMIKFLENRNIAGGNGGDSLSRSLLKAHCQNEVFPNLIRYVNTRSESDWENQCCEACNHVMGVSGYALADFLIITMNEYRKRTLLEKIRNCAPMLFFDKIINKIMSGKLRKISRKIYYAARRREMK